MATEKELLFNLLTKAYNKPETEVAQMIYNINEKGEVEGIKDEAPELLLNLDANRVKSWKDRQTETITKAVGEAQASVHTRYETQLREITGITDPLKGDDLINAIKERMTAVAGTSGKGKSSAEYLELEAQKKALEMEIQTKYIPIEKHNEYVNGVERGKRLSVAEREAIQVKSKLPLIYPEQEYIRKNLDNAFIKALNERYDDVELTNDGKIYPLKNGQRIENSNGYAVELSEIVKETALGFYPEAKQQPTGNAGNGSNGNNGSGSNVIDDIQKKLADPNLPYAERMSLLTQLEAEKLKK